jgi:MFS family permease
LSDEFGRKPLMFFPMLGIVVSILFNIINYAFIEDLPLEFFYLDNVGSFFGGYAVLYLGTYSYVTNVTKPEERAQRLARLDGFEVFGYVTGTLASPLILKNLGYFGNYGFSGGMIALGISYLLIFVKEPVKKTEKSGNGKSLFDLAVKTPGIHLINAPKQ